MFTGTKNGSIKKKRTRH